jgi:hypothetical protein
MISATKRGNSQDGIQRLAMTTVSAESVPGQAEQTKAAARLSRFEPNILERMRDPGLQA